MFPGLTELRLIGCSIELAWTPKSKSNTLTPKTNSQTWWQREISHVMSGILCLFNISHFSSTNCSEVTSKRTQKDSGEERVTAKSKPMMNLIARAPSHVSSSTSVSPGTRSYGSQDPWSSIAEEDRSRRPDKGTDLFGACDHYNHEQFMKASPQQVIQSGMTNVLGLLKSGKLRLRRTNDRGDLMKLLGKWYEKFDLVTRKFFLTEHTIRKERRNTSCQIRAIW